MVHIGIGIAVGTAVLMTCCVLIFWCNTEAIPALAKCPYVTYRLYNNIRSQLKITHKCYMDYTVDCRGDHVL